jgi:hypothetical protein
MNSWDAISGKVVVCFMSIVAMLLLSLCASDIAQGGSVETGEESSNTVSNSVAISVHVWGKFNAAELCQIKSGLEVSQIFQSFAAGARSPEVQLSKFENSVRIDLYSYTSDMKAVTRWDTLILSTVSNRITTCGNGMRREVLDVAAFKIKTNSFCYRWSQAIPE